MLRLLSYIEATKYICLLHIGRIKVSLQLRVEAPPYQGGVGEVLVIKSIPLQASPCKGEAFCTLH